MDNEFLISAFSIVRRRIRSLRGNHEEDALQEAFCRLWLKRGEISSRSEAEGLLTVTSRRLMIDEIRRRQSHPETDLEGVESIGEESGKDEEAEQFREIQRLIDKALSPRDSEILRRRDHDGWEFDEIADYFEISEANARMIVSRARKTIRELYRNRREI